MEAFIYTAMTGAAYAQRALGVRANNLANAQTAGFRADLVRAESLTPDGVGYDSRHLAHLVSTDVDVAPVVLQLVRLRRQVEAVDDLDGLRRALGRGGTDFLLRDGIADANDHVRNIALLRSVRNYLSLNHRTGVGLRWE